MVDKIPAVKLSELGKMLLIMGMLEKEAREEELDAIRKGNKRLRPLESSQIVG